METLAASQIFSRILVEGIDERRIIKAPAGGQSLFGEPMGNGGGTRYVTDSTIIEFDVRDGNRGSSTYIHRGIVAKPLNKPKHVSGNFTSLARSFPLLHDTGIVTADQLLKRSFSEPPHQPWDQFRRARAHAGEVFEDIVIDHISAMERSSWQMIKTGKMDLIFGTTLASERIDTKRPAAHTLTCSASWATAGTDILGDIDAACTVGIESGVGSYDVMCVGSAIPGYISKNTDILALADIKAAGTSGFELIWFGENFKPGPQFAHLIANGFNPICRLRTTLGRTVNIFTYEGTYKPNGGSTTYHMTAEEVCYFRSDAACDRYFGPPEKLTPTQQMVADWNQVFGFSPESITLPPYIDATGNVIDNNAFSCDIMRTSDNKAYEVTCQVAPMFITRDTKSFAYMADATSP